MAAPSYKQLANESNSRILLQFFDYTNLFKGAYKNRIRIRQKENHATKNNMALCWSSQGVDVKVCWDRFCFHKNSNTQQTNKTGGLAI